MDQEGLAQIVQFVGGRSTGSVMVPFDEVSRVLTRQSESGGFVAAKVVVPQLSDLSALMATLELKPLLRRELMLPNPRARLDFFADQAIAYVSAAHYVEDPERIEFFGVYAFLTKSVVVFAELSHGGPSLDWSPSEVDYVEHGTYGVLFQFLMNLAGSYSQVAGELEQDVTDVEIQVFGGDVGAPEHIYRLGREILNFQQAVSPIADALDDELDDIEGASILDDTLSSVTRHLSRRFTRVAERASALRELLSEILQANSALIGIKQNEDMKKISAWAAILIVPTLVAGIYGMNFRHMPELHWALGYPYAIGVMVVACVALYVAFKRKDWL